MPFPTWLTRKKKSSLPAKAKETDDELLMGPNKSKSPRKSPRKLSSIVSSSEEIGPKSRNSSKEGMERKKSSSGSERETKKNSSSEREMKSGEPEDLFLDDEAEQRSGSIEGMGSMTSQSSIPEQFNKAMTIEIVALDESGAEMALPTLKVLLVEDNALNRMLAAKLIATLQFPGYSSVEVVEADDGIAAVQHSLRDEFNVILMDLFMPGMDGFQATEAILSNGSNKNRTTPIIALTADATGRDKCLQCGMVDFLEKPFRKNQLAAIIGRVIEKKRPC